jgi:hypothetical protein
MEAAPGEWPFGDKKAPLSVDRTSFSGKKAVDSLTKHQINYLPLDL